MIVKGEREGRANEHLTTRGLSMLTRILTGVKATDVNGQPKVFGRELLDHMHVEVNNFAFDPYVLTVAKNLGWSIETISVDFRKRTHGISKSSYNMCRKLRTIAEFIYTIFRFSRIR